MPVLTYLEAIRHALFEEMRRDESVFCLGEDIGAYGGAFKVTQGLYEEFGGWRVLDTPIAETAIVGAAIGAAWMGLRPVVEIQFADFITCGFDQITNIAAKSHYLWKCPVPMVIRAPHGGGIHGGPFHSQCPEAWFVHTPGLKVVVPSTPRDARGLLLSAIRDNNPVLYFEHKYLYRRLKEEVSEDDAPVPLGQAAVRREGRDLAMITYGAMMHKCLAAAETLEGEGVSVEVVDLRSLKPLDEEAVLRSVRKCSRVLLVQEDVRFGGIVSDLAALIAERAFEDLDAPVRTVTAPDTPVPFSPPMEAFYLPDEERIMAAAREVVGY